VSSEILLKLHLADRQDSRRMRAELQLTSRQRGTTAIAGIGRSSIVIR